MIARHATESYASTLLLHDVLFTELVRSVCTWTTSRSFKDLNRQSQIDEDTSREHVLPINSRLHTSPVHAHILLGGARMEACGQASGAAAGPRQSATCQPEVSAGSRVAPRARQPPASSGCASRSGAPSSGCWLPPTGSLAAAGLGSFTSVDWVLTEAGMLELS